MRATCETERFRKAFALAARAAMAKGPKPILSNVRFDASPEGSWLSATNLEVGVRVPVFGCEVRDGGSALLPASEMGAILATADSASVSLALDDGRVTVLDGRSKFRLSSAPAVEFPEVPAFGDSATITVAVADFLTAAKRVVPCIDGDTKKVGGVMSGVLLEVGEGTMALVATDGRRLARCEFPAAGEGPKGLDQRIVPGPGMAMIAGTFGDSEGDMEIDLSSPSDARFRCGGIELSVRLLSGRFPRYGDAIPARDLRSVELAAGELRRLAERAAISASQETRAADFLLGDDRLTVSSASERSDAAVESELAAGFAPLAFRLNLSFLIPALKALADDTSVTLGVTSAKDPVAVRSDGYILIVMPLSGAEAAAHAA